MKSVLMDRLHTAVGKLRARIAEAEAERDHYYSLYLESKCDVEFYRMPASEREFCPRCGKPRDRHCPDCGTMYPE